MKNFWTILAVVAIVAGCVIGHFSTVPVADCSAIALEAFGFTVLVIKTVKKAEKKTWKEYVTVILFVVGGVSCAVAGIAESTMTTIITTVAGLVALIAGLLIIKKKND